MMTDTHGHGKGLNDLYILPANEQESVAIVAWLKSRKIRHSWELSNIEGQDWNGKRFIEIPGGECYADEIQQAIAG